MTINICHYHLNPGGVTRIIHSQIQSLIKVIPDAKIRVLCAYVPDHSGFESLDVEIIKIEMLDYFDEEQAIKTTPGKVINELEKFIDNEDIIHFHNLNLGKNPVVTAAAYQMAKEGHKIFNHCHDFAEDRPANWAFLRKVIDHHLGLELKKVLYPDFPNYKFGTLNLKDLERLHDYGVDQSRAFLLPNPVGFSGQKFTGSRKEAKEHVYRQLPLDPDKLIVTYPVRVIRRKNIGEFILLALLFSEKANWLVTQPPKNPVEIKFYDKWLAFCRENGLNIIFEAGNKADFEKLITASDFCITTSVQEGFGMAYLEPWLMDTPVIGRDIPFITKELTDNGIIFPKLYDFIHIPGSRSDFKDLAMEKQQEIIVKALKDQEYRKDLFNENPGLESLLKPVPRVIVKKNREIIISEYAIEKYGKKLNEIYQSFTR